MMKAAVRAIVATFALACSIATLLAPQLTLAEGAPRYFASPLPGVPTLASFAPEEQWRGGVAQSLNTPWGQASAVLLTADDGEASTEADIRADLSNSNLRLTFYTDSAESIDHISIVFDAGFGEFTNVFRTDLTEINVSPGNYVVNNGWNSVAKPRRFAYSPSNLAVEEWAHIDAIRLIVGAKPGKHASVQFVRMEALPMPPRGIVSLTFDHVPANMPQRIPAILSAHGYAGSAFATPGWVGRTLDRRWASLDQLRALHDRGWDIGLHAWNDHPDFTKLQPGQARFQLNQGAAWLDDNGFSKPLRLWASPEATWNNDVLTMAAQYFDACRCANGSGTFPPEDKFLVRAIGVVQGESPDELLEWVRAAGHDREWLILNFHYFDEGSYEYSYDTAQFARFIDGLATIEDVDVQTLSQVLQRLP